MRLGLRGIGRTAVFSWAIGLPCGPRWRFHLRNFHEKQFLYQKKGQLRLTCPSHAPNLLGMRFSRPVLIAILGFALAAYALDCGAMSTPEQAMQCCNSMPCSSGGHHGQDCCKTMPAMHAPFVQPSVAHGVSCSPIVVAALAMIDVSPSVNSSTRGTAENSHAPPTISSSAPLALRI